MFVASNIFPSKIMAMQYKDFQSRNFYVKALYEVIYVPKLSVHHKNLKIA